VQSTLITEAYRQRRDSLESRIANGIRTTRMATAGVRVVSGDGSPIAGARVEAVQTGHAFHFGANCFLLGGYDSAELNGSYESRFLGLFNAATVALYWRDLEPEQGRPRFALDSDRIWRRPAVDLAVDWCRKHRLNMNGHPLVWDSRWLQVPEWMPADHGAIRQLTERHIRGIAKRYGSVIQRWDVVNERLHSFLGRRRPGIHVDLPDDFDIQAFRVAQATLPPEAVLMLNDYWEVWNPRSDAFHRLVARLEGEGARIDALGLQMHNFKVDEVLAIGRDEGRFRADELLAALDGYLRLGRPLYVSEITLPQPVEGSEGEAAQAELVRDLYRLCFSHPAVHGITWWNVADGGAVGHENGILSGLIDRQHRPKAAYQALDQLINRDWRTRTGRMTTDAEGAVRFRGFKGTYAVEVSACGRTWTEERCVPGDLEMEIRLP
jgi:endo-1,4-beta-xylanase